ncbi:MAG TPA: lyase family protein, partial [Nocardioides sp.]|nr:lyase family protein [Nocardioides sp.]
MTGDAANGYLGLGTRLNSGPSRLLVEAGFATEVRQSRFLHSWIGVADLVHVLALRDAEAIPAEPGRRLLRTLLDMQSHDWAEMPYDPVHGDVYNNREHLLRGLLGDDAGWLHLGRTRREAGRVAFYLAARAGLLDLHDSVTSFASAALAGSREHVDTWWSDLTYLQPAQVSSLGHYLLSFGHEASRQLDRVRRAHDACGNLPVAAGGVAGTTVPVCRASYLERLGVTFPATTSRDAMWGTDILVEVAHVATQAALTVSKLAEDLMIFGSPPFGWVRIHDSHSRASVYLPQKRNPYALSVIRGGTSRLLGRATGVLTSVRTPSAQTDNWIYNYGDVLETVELASSLVSLASEVLARATFDRDRLAAAALDDFTEAPDLAESMVVSSGIDYRTAHEAVARVAEAAHQRGQRRFAAADYDRLGLTGAVPPPASAP